MLPVMLLALAWIVVVPSVKPLAMPTGDIVATRWRATRPANDAGQVLAGAVVEHTRCAVRLFFANKRSATVNRFDDDRSQTVEIDRAD